MAAPAGRAALEHAVERREEVKRTGQIADAKSQHLQLLLQQCRRAPVERQVARSALPRGYQPHDVDVHCPGRQGGKGAGEGHGRHETAAHLVEQVHRAGKDVTVPPSEKGSQGIQTHVFGRRWRQRHVAQIQQLTGFLGLGIQVAAHAIIEVPLPSDLRQGCEDQH